MQRGNVNSDWTRGRSTGASHYQCLSKKKKEVNQPRLLPQLASRCTDENQSEIEICIH